MIQKGTEEMQWKELAQIYLNQSSNFLLAQKTFGLLVKIKWNFSKSLLNSLLKIILEVFLWFLGGSDHGEIISSFKLSDGILKQDHFLKWDLEEVDDQTIFHVNHPVKVDEFSKVALASSDTVVFVCALSHFSSWMHFELDELWIIKGNVTVSILHWFTQLLATWTITLLIYYLQYRH